MYWAYNFVQRWIGFQPKFMFMLRWCLTIQLKYRLFKII